MSSNSLETTKPSANGRQIPEAIFLVSRLSEPGLSTQAELKLFGRIG